MNKSSSKLVISGSQINSLQTKWGKTITVKIPKKFLKDPSPGSMKALALVLNHKLNMLLIDDNANNDSNETSVDNEDIDDKVKAFCEAVPCDPGQNVKDCYTENAKKDHPDKRGDEEKFKAYKTLYEAIDSNKNAQSNLKCPPTTNVTTGPIGPSNTVKTVSGNVAVINDSEPSNLGLGSTIRDTSTDTSSNKSSSSSSSTVPSREISSSSSSYNLSTISDGNSIPETIDDGTSMPDTIETHLNTSKDGDHPANGKNETMNNTLQKYWSAMIKKTELSIEFKKKELIINDLSIIQEEIKGKDKNSITIKSTRDKKFMPNIKENISEDLKNFYTVHDAIVQYQKPNDKHESEILDHSKKITEIKKKIEFIRDVLYDLIKINNDKSELF
jgi:hypothetical protein